MSSAISSAYDYYLTTYGSKQVSRYDSHKKEDLRKTVNKIKILNKESPLYKVRISDDVQKFAIDIKEGARNIKNVVAEFSETEEGIGAAFQKKIATSSNPEIVTAEYVGDTTFFTTEEGFEIEVLQLATPQTNIGNFLKRDEHDFAPGSYAFDLNINSNSYEFQYNINHSDSNEDVLHKLARLFGNAHIGIKAEILNGSQQMAALRLESNQTGLAPHESEIFQIIPENTRQSRESMKLLGIDAVTNAAENATFLLNGTKHSSYLNTFTINNSFSVTLNGISKKNEPVIIGFKPGSEAVTDDVELLVNTFNSILSIADKYKDSRQSNEKLLKDMGTVSKTFSSSLSPMGLSVSDNGQITVDRDKLKNSIVSKQAGQNLDVLNRFKDALGRKADEASLDPMSYVSKTLVVYRNPNSAKNLVTPYISSVYAGMMVDRIC